MADEIMLFVAKYLCIVAMILITITMGLALSISVLCQSPATMVFFIAAIGYCYYALYTIYYE